MKLQNLLKRLIYKERYDSNTYIKYLKKKGVTVGKNCRIFDPKNTTIDLQNPYLITIGDNVKITKGVIILTHDYSWSVLATLYHEILGGVNTVHIGNNCFIGMNTIILKNTQIGENVIIGAGSIVTGKIESNSIYAGNPAKKIMTIEEFYKKRKEKQQDDINKIAKEYKKKTEKLPDEQILKEYFWNYKEREDKLTEEQKGLIERTGCRDEILEKYKVTKPNIEGIISIINNL